MPLVSVIIPTFNRADILKRSLKSVLKQSFTDFEVIIIDDASSDDTLSFLKEQSDPRLKVISLPCNAGVSAARNRGILQAKGDYLAFLDSDDEWHRKKLEKQVAFLEEHPESVILHCNEKWVRNGEHLNQRKIHRKEGGDIFERALELCLISPSAVVIKKSFLIDIGLFREDYLVCEDYELWLRITAVKEVDFLEDVLVTKYGGHEDQLSQRFKAMDYWRVKAMDEVFNSGILKAQQEKALREVLVKKCLILKAGYLKHDNLENLTTIENLLSKYSSSEGRRAEELVLYHPSFGTELSDYGINLPLRDDRSEKVFGILKEHFENLSEVNPQEIPLLSLEDLKGIHEGKFLQRLAVDSSFLEEILKAYECEDPKRYFPEGAIRPISQLRESILRQVSATFFGLEKALKNQFCFFLGGGMHHAHFDHGSGFCPLNDIVISLELAQTSGLIKRGLVIDTDAHFGDGSAQMSKNNDSITTFSIHMKDAWPLEEASDIQSDLDIPIGVGEEDLYLRRLSSGLKNLEAEEFDCAIVVAGADPHCDDELTSTQKLRLSSSQMLARDMAVYKWCTDRKIPQLWLMAGGYGESAPKIYAQFILKILHLMG